MAINSCTTSEKLSLVEEDASINKLYVLLVLLGTQHLNDHDVNDGDGVTDFVL